MRVSVKNWRRRFARVFTLLLALALVAAVAPARFRDRGGSRSSARASSARSEFHHDDCELPLHVAAADWYRTNAVTTTVSSVSFEDDALPADSLASTSSTWADEYTISLETPDISPASPLLTFTPSRAPPA